MMPSEDAIRNGGKSNKTRRRNEQKDAQGEKAIEYGKKNRRNQEANGVERQFGAETTEMQ